MPRSRYWSEPGSSPTTASTLAHYRSARWSRTITVVCGWIWVAEEPAACEACHRPYRPRRAEHGWDADARLHYIRCRECGHTWLGETPMVRQHQLCRDPACPAKTRP